MTFQKVSIEISKRENGAFKPLGNIEIHVPLLEECLKFIAGAEQAKDEKTSAPLFDEDTGLPIYVAPEANWIQDAILSSVRATARSRLAKDSVELKNPEQKIPEDWATLTAQLPRGSGGKALELARQFRESFAEWVAKQGLSDNAQQALVTLVGNRNALAVQDQRTKDKVMARLTSYADALDETTLEKFLRPLGNVQDACKAITADDALNF